MKIRRIEHVAIAVRDLAESRRFWEGVLGIRRRGVERFPPLDLELEMYPVGDSMIELIAGTRPGSAYARLVAERGDILHHVCLEVEDLDGALDELRAKGVRLRDETPRTGHGGARIAFLDPASTGQVLVELVEPPGAAGQRH
jgi:methylmalonyl-CoA epimerase